jgi:hypothetical protein
VRGLSPDLWAAKQFLTYEVVKMKNIKVILVLFLIIAGILIPGTEIPVQAAKVRLSKKVLTMETGDSKKISVKGTSEKITWASSDKNVAVVKKGKITAKGAGTCNITATFGTETLTCVVTVNAKKVPMFDATTNVGEITFPVNKQWVSLSAKNQDKTDTIKGYAGSTSILIYEAINVPKDEYAKAVDSKEKFDEIGKAFVNAMGQKVGFTDANTEILTEDTLYIGKTTGMGNILGKKMHMVVYYSLKDGYFIMCMAMNPGESLMEETDTLAFEACKAAKKQ